MIMAIQYEGRLNIFKIMLAGTSKLAYVRKKTCNRQHMKFVKLSLLTVKAMLY